MSFNFFKVWTSRYQIAAMDNLKCSLRFDEVSTKKRICGSLWPQTDRSRFMNVQSQQPCLGQINQSIGYLKKLSGKFGRVPNVSVVVGN